MHNAAIFLAMTVQGPICAWIGFASRWYVGIAAFAFLNAVWLVPAMLP